MDWNTQATWQNVKAVIAFMEVNEAYKVAQLARNHFPAFRVVVLRDADITSHVACVACLDTLGDKYDEVRAFCLGVVEGVVVTMPEHWQAYPCQR